MFLFTIRDIKADSYNRPFASATRGTAIRAIQQNLHNDTAMRDYSEDFQLFEIGSWDAVTGNITANTVPHHIIDISELQPEDVDQVDLFGEPTNG